MTRHPIVESADEAAGAWENEGGRVGSTPEDQELGITRTWVKVFGVGAFRYNKLSDALAQASHERAAS